MRTFVQYSLICAISVLLFDAATYVTGIKEQFFPTISGRLSYPDGYFKADPVLGHDITPNISPIDFNWGDHTAQIFSNSYGCFDKHQRYKEPLIYLTGDSLAWGYADYEKKYGYLIEKELGINIAKCGVTHSGQKHQLIRLKRWIAKTGVKPELILLSWVSNDPENDFLFPQATAIKGKFVDQATTENVHGNPVRATVPEIDKRLEKFEQKQMQKEMAQYSLSSQVIGFFKEYSITAHILRRSLNTFIGSSLREHIKTQNQPINQEPIKQANYDAMQEFLDYAKSLDIPVVILTYSGTKIKTADIYKFLKNQNQVVIDFPTFLEENNMTTKNLKWPLDGHPNNHGNDLIARLYIDAIKAHNLLAPKQ